ncbi:MAG: hypothetical protein HC851_08615 [Acaryochloris sp. RU_4_1]|nr:hypothetical protein [Acaryochloris sp. RU_4_1]
MPNSPSFNHSLQDGETVALGASHAEKVSEWVGAIRGYLEKAEGAVSFSELVSGVRLPCVVVWLGVLLGGFEVRQVGGFYAGGGIWPS